MIKRSAIAPNSDVSLHSAYTQRSEKPRTHANIISLSFTDNVAVLFLMAALLVQYSFNPHTSAIQRRNNVGNAILHHLSKKYSSGRAAQGLTPQNLWNLYNLPASTVAKVVHCRGHRWRHADSKIRSERL